MSNNITSKDKFSNQEFLREDSPKSLHEFSKLIFNNGI